MRKKEFMEKLCGLLAEFDMDGQPMHNAFPCICGENAAATDDSEVCAVTAGKIFDSIQKLIDKQPTYCCLCNGEMTLVSESEDPMLSLYRCTNSKCPEEA
jgi:hypothetical protein